jgi:hypothetical protein
MVPPFNSGTFSCTARQHAEGTGTVPRTACSAYQARTLLLWVRAVVTHSAVSYTSDGPLRAVNGSAVPGAVQSGSGSYSSCASQLHEATAHQRMQQCPLSLMLGHYVLHSL